MEESLECDDIDNAGVDELAAGELAGIGQDWDVVMQMLPAQWETKAIELGAVQRLRGFDSVGSLLRVLLIHLADGCSLRETAVRASAGGLAAVSDVALLKRLRGCAPWFEWMAREMAADMALPLTAQALLPGRRVRLIDGSSVSEPGATGSTWRLHYALNLHTLSCDEVHVTEADIGESLTHFDIQAGDVIMADRGFAKRPSLRYAVQRKADVVLRASLSNLPLHDQRARPLDLFPKLRTLAIGQAADWPARVQDDIGAIPVRVCAYKKTVAQTLATQQAIEKEARKKGRSVQPQTLEAAGYVIDHPGHAQRRHDHGVLPPTLADRAGLQEVEVAPATRAPQKERQNRCQGVAARETARGLPDRKAHPHGRAIFPLGLRRSRQPRCSSADHAGVNTPSCTCS